ncbi:hypothetical protein ACWIG3_16340 [Streptomyces celluloflavus]
MPSVGRPGAEGVAGGGGVVRHVGGRGGYGVAGTPTRKRGAELLYRVGDIKKWA